MNCTSLGWTVEESADRDKQHFALVLVNALDNSSGHRILVFSDIVTYWERRLWLNIAFCDDDDDDGRIFVPRNLSVPFQRI